MGFADDMLAAREGRRGDWSGVVLLAGAGGTKSSEGGEGVGEQGEACFEREVESNGCAHFFHDDGSLSACP